MNVIVFMLDSLRQDGVSYYGRYGCPPKTPKLDALAAEAVVFENCYPEGLPTIPVRADLMTGQSTLSNRAWQPMSATDVTAAEIFRDAGFQTVEAQIPGSFDGREQFGEGRRPRRPLHGRWRRRQALRIV